ncbi:MAG: hypothetical protein L0Y55_20815 [Anaerolineales bacterium]|nr:hypothetical protein [Anaerolineales bacterium]
MILTFGADGLSGHPDHLAIGECAAAAFRRAPALAALYTVAVPQSLATRLGMTQVRAVPDELIALTVDVMPAWDAKLAAIHCHATQMNSSPITRASLERQRAFLGAEHFVCAARRSETDSVATNFRSPSRPS